MNQYTLDYSSLQPQQRVRRTKQPIRRASRQVLLLICGSACGIALIGVLRMRSEVALHRRSYQTKVIQYDSLLAAKLEVDRQLAKLIVRKSTTVN